MDGTGNPDPNIRMDPLTASLCFSSGAIEGLGKLWTAKQNAHARGVLSDDEARYINEAWADIYSIVCASVGSVALTLEDMRKDEA